MKLLGMLVFGVWLPFIGRQRIPLNRDGSLVDTGLGDLTDEKGFYYVNPLVFEWFGLGRPLSPSPVYLTSNNEIVDPDTLEWAVAGAGSGLIP